MLASEFLNYKNWVVVGDVVNNKKYAYRILTELQKANFNVKGVKAGTGNDDIYENLQKVPYKIEVLDLCINPHKGIKIVEEALKLGIDKILIQPGAESEEIISFCKDNGINAIQGCALIELSKR